MIRTAIFGYGNLGRGTLRALLKSADVEVVGVFTRREKAEVIPEGNTAVISASDIFNYENEIDVLFVCGGSADDLPTFTPLLAERFNVVDSFDRHPEIRRHLRNVDFAAKRGGKLALVSAGWDPGIFSVVRLMSKAVFPDCAVSTFWGEGVSQGHSEAVRRVNGVKDAIQLTEPKGVAVESAIRGEPFDADPHATHKRVCFVVPEEGSDKARIEREIRTMPDYFDGYETTVSFVTENELYARFPTMHHGGQVIATANSEPAGATARFLLSMKSNPDFTGAVLAACGRAVYAVANRGRTGAITVFELSPADFAMPTLDMLSFL